MTFEAVFAATLLVLLGIGAGLTVSGHRYGRAPIFWSGVTILIVVVGFMAIELLGLILCWSGAGCI